MLFNNGFHRGSHYRPPRSRVRGSCGASAGTMGAEPANSQDGPQRDVVRSNATTIITVRDKNDPKRTKTIITLKRRKITRPPSPPQSGPVSEVRQSRSGSLVRSTSRRDVKTYGEVKCDPETTSSVLVVPVSPASTLLSNWKNSALQRSPSCNSLKSAHIDGSEISCDTTFTQVDDGLSDWGLPKVIDYHGVPGQDEADVDDDCEELAVPVGLHSTLEVSAFPYDDPAVASLDIPVPSVAQVRLQRFLVLMYIALFLRQYGIVPSRFKTRQFFRENVSKTTPKIALPFRKPSVLRFSPFSSWI